MNHIENDSKTLFNCYQLFHSNNISDDASHEFIRLILYRQAVTRHNYSTFIWHILGLIQPSHSAEECYGSKHIDGNN